MSDTPAVATTTGRRRLALRTVFSVGVVFAALAAAAAAGRLPALPAVFAHQIAAANRTAGAPAGAAADAHAPGRAPSLRQWRRHRARL